MPQSSDYGERKGQKFMGKWGIQIPIGQVDHKQPKYFLDSVPKLRIVNL